MSVDDFLGAGFMEEGSDEVCSTYPPMGLEFNLSRKGVRREILGRKMRMRVKRSLRTMHPCLQ